jgi:uncharacterized protein (TIGR00725 family)
VNQVKQRRPVVGVIGGDRQSDAAKAFGKLVAKAECILLTGGKPQCTDEVKDAAMVGAVSAEADKSIARLIGIIPCTAVSWDQQSEYRLFLKTGIEHNYRNVINGVTPDVLIVFGGSKGTLAEAAFGLAVGKPLSFCVPSRDKAIARLLKNLDWHFEDKSNSSFRHNIDTYLKDPVAAFSFWPKGPPSVEELKAKLRDVLTRPPEAAANEDELISWCKEAAADAVCGPTGFPGLPGVPQSKANFERIVSNMST